MDQQLKLTARGHAVCELMAELGLSLDAACARVDQELEALRERVEAILNRGKIDDLSEAMQAALDSVSPSVQDAYLEEASFVTRGVFSFGSPASSAVIH